VCIDYRAVNSVMDEPIADNVPLVADLYNKVSGKKYFSSLDLKWSFHQLQVAPEDREKTAFTWLGKRWMFRGCPFGMKHLTGRMQGVMSKILRDCYDFTFIFVDDLIIMSDSLEEHIAHVQKVLALLTAANFKLNTQKCHFGFSSIQALGHIVSGDGRYADPEKVATWQEWKRPETGKQVMALMGFVNFMRDYVPLMASVAAPIEPLRSKAKITQADWSPECEESLQSLKNILNSKMVIKPLVEGLPLKVACDASQTGIGAVLYQEKSDGEKRYICFASKSLNKGQANYSATKRELLAVVFALQRFRPWIVTRRFELLTDHRALMYMFNADKVNHMVEDWLDVIMSYDFTVTHCPGVLNVLPDALSRMYPDRMTNVSRPKVPIPPSYRKTVTVKALKGRKKGVKVPIDSLPPVPTGVKSQAIEEFLKYPERELSSFIKERMDKTLVPESDREAILQSCHNATGHKGAEFMFKALWADGHFWPGMRRDCTLHAAGCLSCCRWNIGKSGYHPMKGIIPDVHEPFHHIAMDLADMTDYQSVDGINYVLVIVDLFTKFMVFRPLKEKTMNAVAAELFEVGNFVGHFRVCQSDNGSEFKNSVIRDYNRLLGSEHRFVAAYNPEANGVAENAVKAMKNGLNKTIGGDVTHWNKYLSSVQLGLNSTMTALHKSNPFFSIWEESRSCVSTRKEPAANSSK
jgi:RNase H-like domain found in reverse transcriptase/Reverse transcriptase (RNA-dependent DNA polymerase)/Integrase zinc binding domain